MEVDRKWLETVLELDLDREWGISCLFAQHMHRSWFRLGQSSEGQTKLEN